MHTRRDPPPRLPLWVMISHRTDDGMFVDQFVVVKPGDKDYEAAYAYAYAARRHLVDGEPMPYMTEANAAPPARP